MTYDYVREHEHELEAEYLSAMDAASLEIYEEDGSLWIDTIVPCPTCSEPLQLSARVHRVAESDVELPLYD